MFVIFIIIFIFDIFVFLFINDVLELPLARLMIVSLFDYKKFIAERKYFFKENFVQENNSGINGGQFFAFVIFMAIFSPTLVVWLIFLLVSIPIRKVASI